MLKAFLHNCAFWWNKHARPKPPSLEDLHELAEKRDAVHKKRQLLFSQSITDAGGKSGLRNTPGTSAGQR